MSKDVLIAQKNLWVLTAAVLTTGAMLTAGCGGGSSSDPRPAQTTTNQESTTSTTSSSTGTGTVNPLAGYDASDVPIGQAVGSGNGPNTITGGSTGSSSSGSTGSSGGARSR